MKFRLPSASAIFATSLNFMAMAPKDGSQNMQTAQETPRIDSLGEATEATPCGSGYQSQSAGESLFVQQIFPADRVWDRAAQRRFKALAVKEALQTITTGELAELESLSSLRRRETAPKATAEEMASELRRWQYMNRAVKALQGYVHEIGTPGKIESRS
jgi:hypothetical protein